ncbi:putative alpha,alpha-trehalose-phosphate synthase [UDP-forming] 11 [Camellia lanceoleosa]|uniref:Alpha,alpha-trehalose-phosphate synthase [UDP-forming] 11 n=1 Tax=Camellia lanceoleosa TaxID=1840588 RepID=A0ACC0HXC8_9ERIC|nr:putative alpha,alpha-trehalose-phosphate synthase [UDP-forming] 11 [Camellia lanceoleosa]
MLSRSSLNLLNLHDYSNFDEDNNGESEVVREERRIIVAHQLSLVMTRGESNKWCFDWDRDALVLELKDGFPKHVKVIYCVPVFLMAEIHNKFYHGFCKHCLWPLFHDLMLLVIGNNGGGGGGDRFDLGLWEAYVSANKEFADRVRQGISCKFLAIGHLLEVHPGWRGRVVLVQILNPARTLGKVIQEVEDEINNVAKVVNVKYVCRQCSPILDEALGLEGSEMPRNSVIVVSEFIGCSLSLSGAIKVNPWDIDSVSHAMNSAITMPDAQRQIRHEKHYKYINSHNIAYWARSFDKDFERASSENYKKRCWGTGFGFGLQGCCFGS